MTAAGWSKAWLGHAAPARRELWRAVEAQHRVATLRLVDDLDEQALLEQLLESSKPPLPPGAGRHHFLLSTPFRYLPPWPSRFRRPGEPGAWYGAQERETVAAEVAWWRWRFLEDSQGLREGQVLSELTFFLARFTGRELDLTQSPWRRHRATWRDPADYAGCHALAAAARAHAPPVQSIRYESARREGGLCQVVFDPGALALPRPAPQQTWVCKVMRHRVLLTHDTERLQFEMA
ncbi:RES family NAD+ phosphorylase [Ramlibacter sp. MAHUQ-53]|uniref:RES family NAD+ phosphorylase n=1 Tax=unclassified Ramlibacter TaxID=2617605 RepID=UPI0036390C88